VNADAREITLPATPPGSGSWAALRRSAGIGPDEWRARARAAMSGGAGPGGAR
jgi:hypothetical protein